MDILVSLEKFSKPQVRDCLIVVLESLTTPTRFSGDSARAASIEDNKRLLERVSEAYYKNDSLKILANVYLENTSFKLFHHGCMHSLGGQSSKVRYFNFKSSAKHVAPFISKTTHQ